MPRKDVEQTNHKLREQYLGEKRNELREGFGVYVYENKFFRYEGEWQHGKKHGHGKLIMADGSYYEGQFRNGEIRGHGFRYWSVNGNKYAGQFEKGELHGRGVMEYKDGAVYEGDWYRNVRQGRGKLTDKYQQVYDGEFHNHKRHGEGRQTYTNGDVYEGNWVMDRRQGHGYLEKSDGTTYDGQWLNDVYSGHGRMLHCSGIMYEGPWIHGEPSMKATQLLISNGPAIQCCQGTPFEVVVEIRTEDDEVISIESGRELRVSSWFRARPPVTAVNGEGGGATGPLLDLIEETEEKTRSTPFGYEVVPFALTDEMPSREMTSLVPEYTAINEVEEDDNPDTLPESTEDTVVPSQEDDKPTTPTPDEAPNENLEKPETLEETTDVVSGAAPEDAIEREETSISVDITQEESPPLPPVPNVRTDEGCAIWETLLLPRAPALYRPYALIDEEAGIVNPALKDAKNKLKDKRRTGSKEKEKVEGRDEEDYDDDDATLNLSEDAKSKYKRLGNPNFARPGEYIIMVEDVSEPLFFDQRLEPAFLKVELQAPKRERRRSCKKVVEEKKKWSTEEVIARSMARASVQLVEKDVARFRERRTETSD